MKLEILVKEKIDSGEIVEKGSWIIKRENNFYIVSSNLSPFEKWKYPDFSFNEAFGDFIYFALMV